MTQDRDAKSEVLEMGALEGSACAQKAEDALDVSTLTTEELQKLVHDLQAHQIELKMQNEYLRQAQEDLRRSEELFRKFFEINVNYCYMISSEGVILDVNASALKTLGYRREELVGRSIATIYAPESLDRAMKAFEKWKRTGRVESEELAILTKTGQRRTVVLNVSAAKSNGETMRSLSVQTDITERKEVEQALDRACHEWERTFNAISDLVMVLDDRHKILRANKAMANALGQSDQEIIGRFCFELVHGEKAPPAFCPHSRLLADGQEHSAEAVEPRLGEVCDIRVSPLVGQDGQVAGSVHVIRDMTERKRAEEALRESEAFYRSLYENISDCIFIIDVTPDQRFKFVRFNPAEEKAVGMTTEQVANKYTDDLVSKAVAEHVKSRYRMCLEQRRTIQYEEVLDLPKGKISFSTSLVPVEGRDGRIHRIIGVARDITERKRTEDIMLARLRLVEYAASHSLDELLQATLDEVEVLTGSLIGFYHFLEADERTLRLQAWSTRTLREMCAAEGKGLHYDIDKAGVWVDCVRERKPVIHNDYSALPHRKGMPAGHAEVIRELVVPVVRGDRIVGILGVGNKPVDYEASDIETVSLLADLAWDIAERKLAEEALREASSYNRSLIEASLDPLVTISAQGKITDANSATERVTGYSRQKLIGTDFADYFADTEKAKSGYEQAFKEGAVKDYELHIRHRNGDLTPVMYNASVYYDNLGQVAGLFAAARDVTKQKRAEQALRDSREQYRAVFNNAGIGIKMLNRDRRIVRANPALLQMLGYSEKEFLELTPLDTTHPDDREMTNQCLDLILGNGPESLRLEKRYLRKDGSVIWGDVSISAMRDAQGNRITALEVIADITDRMKSQIALQESEKRIRRIIDSSPVGIRITQEGRHVYANRALASMFGYESQEEILGLPSEALFAPESQPLIRQRIANRMAGKTIPPHYEASGLTKQGKIISLESWGTEINYLGKKSWLAFIIDVSEARSLRTQLLQAQKMESVATLAGGIAHDFNNNLQVILGYSDMLLFHKKSSDPDYEGLHAIREAGRDASDMAKRILAFSRRLEPNVRPVSLNNEIRRVRKMLERTVPKMIGIELHLADDLMTVNADPGQLEQVLLNLAVNAQHAMPDGGVLTIETLNETLDEDYSRTHVDVEPGKYVLVSVSDTGHGMDKEVVEHIFEPFYTTKGPREGTGLGLAMVFGIVKSHKGHITCYSEPGIGTTFKIYLPAIIREIAPDVAVTREMPAFGTETILLVDDEKSILKLGEQMLAMAGYRVLTAANGREALDVYRSSQADIALVLLDLIMPEMGGKQCLEGLLEINPRVRVVIASGYSANGTTRDAVPSGARGFVNKPYDAKEILTVVRKVLDESPEGSTASSQPSSEDLG